MVADAFGVSAKGGVRWAPPQPIAGRRLSMAIEAVPIVLINLDRSTDQLAHMQGEFARAGVTFERFPAVDGTTVPDSVKPYFCDASGSIVSTLRPGEVGCYASHLALWQRIAAGLYGPAVLVCEDDWVLPVGFAPFVASLLAAAPPGWDLIRLSPRTKRAIVPVRRIDQQYALVRYSRQPGSSAAYLVSRSGARKLLAPGIRHNPVDQDFKRPWAYGIDSFGVWPPIPERPDARSAIDEMGGRLRSARRWRRLVLSDALREPLHAFRALGLRQWARCAWWNTVGRKLHRPIQAATGGAEPFLR